MIISAKSIDWGLARKDMDQGIANLLQDHGFVLVNVRQPVRAG